MIGRIYGLPVTSPQKASLIIINDSIKTLLSSVHVWLVMQASCFFSSFICVYGMMVMENLSAYVMVLVTTSL